MTTDADKHFDAYAADYDVALASGISVSGEDKNYFAQRRIEWLRDTLPPFSMPPRQVMDYGCGTGSSAPFLLTLLGAENLVGTDSSPRSIEIARQEQGSERARFLPLDELEPLDQFDLVFCNGVFHHISPSERAANVDYIFRSLRPGGLLAFWENNPWNPGTRYVMRRIPFDRDAITLTLPEGRRLLRARGFEILRADFLFIFPRFLRWLRWTEPLCSRLPLGAQYQILCRRPFVR
jgi:SAM-dependent methyltransferase